MRIELEPELKAKLLDPSLTPAEINIAGKRYTSLIPIAGGFKGVVWRAIDEFDRPRAIKFCVGADYAPPNRELKDEMKWAGKLESSGNFARLDDAGIAILELNDGTREEFVFFVEEWVNGRTVESLLQSDEHLISASFFRHYITLMAHVLQELEQSLLRHDDLHVGNVMVVPAQADGGYDAFRIKIIDMGSLKPLTGPTRKPHDDHENFAKHMVEIHNKILQYENLQLRDRRFLKNISGILPSFFDDDQTRGIRSAASITRAVDKAWKQAQAIDRIPGTRLDNPFEYISAEHIADDKVLLDIFAESCPWLDKVSGPDPILLTGPRGCGKSMIFRWLSLRTHRQKELSELIKLRISGFYISCSTEIQNRFAHIRDEQTAARFEREVIHFFNMLLVREVVTTLEFLAGRRDKETVWELTIGTQRRIYEFLRSHITEVSVVELEGVQFITRARELVEAELFSANLDLIHARNRSGCTSAAFIGDFTSLLVSHIGFFRRNKIVFLLDDFTISRVPDEVQGVLNRVIWERRPTHVFKVSAEKYGARIILDESNSADVWRELREVDCGKEFISLDDSNQNKELERFAIELLANRLQAASYKGKAEALIGPSHWDEGSLAKALFHRGKGRTSGFYHGISCISQLCSGDVAALLMIYQEIFQSANVGAETTTLISASHQDRAIREVSRKLFERIRATHPHGAEMFDIANSFGNTIKRVLYDGPLLKKGDAKVPNEMPRIEIDLVDGHVLSSLTERQLAIAYSLLRRAVFIELEPGLSRHQGRTTLRWHMRRVYLPHFMVGLSKTSALKKGPDWFSKFISEPNKACEEFLRDRRKPDQDGGLFAKLGEGDDEGNK